MPTPKHKIQIIRPLLGCDHDTHPSLLSSNKASWLKNIELLYDKGAKATTGVMTPSMSTYTDFLAGDFLPTVRTFQLDFTGVGSFPVYIWGYTKDSQEFILNTFIVNEAALDLLMVTQLGWTKISTRVYQITSSELWQYFGYHPDTNGFGFYLTCTVINKGDFVGNNICIGSHYERTINRFIWFNYNTAGRHNIQMYNANDGIYSTISETPVLNFDYNNRIASTDLVIINNIQDGSTNYLFYWTDNLNPVRKLNIQRALSGEYFNNFPLYYTTPSQWCTNEKYPSFGNLTGALTLDTGFPENYIANNSFQFCYYYGYDDGETSTLSDYSTLYYTTDYLNPPFSSMPNFIELSNISAGGENVYFVVLCFRIGNTGDWNALQPIYRNVITQDNLYGYNPADNTFDYSFYNNQTYTNVQESSVNNNFSLVPIKCLAQRFLTNNILVYGDITEGYNNLTAAERAVPTIRIDYTPITDASLHITGQVNVGLVGAISSDGSVQLSLKHRVNSTGVITTIDSDGVSFVGSTPTGFVWNINKTISPINIYDTVYIEVTTLSIPVFWTFSIGNSNLQGAYSGVTPAGNGNFSVQSTVSQSPTLGSNVLFPVVISDPQNTWGITTGVHTDPNNTVPNSSAHLKQGGNYKFGFILYDYLNRSTFVQASPQLALAVKTVMELGFNASQTITWFWNNLVFPDWVKKVSICRTQDLYCQHLGGIGQQEFIQWITNDADFLLSDNSTAPTHAAATKIRLSLISLGTFNSDNNNITNTQYQFTAGDLIRFITVGGVLQTTIIERQLRGVTGSLNSFYVDMGSALVNLEAGDVIEIHTPLSVPSADIYYEITTLMPTTGVAGNNQAVTQTFTINTFDSYFVNRQGVITILSTANQHISLFESPYRSDFIVNSWGEDIGLGRDNTVNDNASQFEKLELARFSLAYVENTFVNGLSSFLSGNSVQYDSNFGAITYFVCIKNILHVIQTDNVMYSLIAQSLTFLQNGVPQLLTGDQVISKPQDTEGDYGCQDPTTIVQKDNIIFFWDLKRGVIVEYDTTTQKPRAIAKSRKGLAGWTFDESAFIRKNRGTDLDQIKLHGGFDPKRLKYYVTSFKYTATDPYIDLSEQLTVQAKSTVSYHIGMEVIAGSYGFTPEFYGYLDAGLDGDYMISFKDGIPYFHNSNLSPDYLNFYGDNRDVDYIEIACNRDPKDIEETELRSITYGNSVKNFFSVGYDSTRPDFYASGVPYGGIAVYTSNGQQSNIPIASFMWKEGFYYSPFYLNTSTGKTIFTGEKLKGTYLVLRLRRTADPALKNIYNEVGKVVFFINESAKTI